MIRSALSEIGIFLIPFAVYALFLLATRSGVLLHTSWPCFIVFGQPAPPGRSQGERNGRWQKAP